MAQWEEEECQDSLLDDAGTGRQVVVGDKYRLKWTAQNRLNLSIHLWLQYLEKSLEFRVGDVVDLEHVLWLSIITFLHQHHGVDETVHSRQLSF